MRSSQDLNLGLLNADQMLLPTEPLELCHWRLDLFGVGFTLLTVLNTEVLAATLCAVRTPSGADRKHFYFRRKGDSQFTGVAAKNTSVFNTVSCMHSPCKQYKNSTSFKYIFAIIFSELGLGLLNYQTNRIIHRRSRSTESSLVHSGGNPPLLAMV